MEAHQERVVVEKAELDEKRLKLGAFLDSKMFFTLPEAERERLVRQASIMVQYSDVLGERIKAFGFA